MGLPGGDDDEQVQHHLCLPGGVSVLERAVPDHVTDPRRGAEFHGGATRCYRLPSHQSTPGEKGGGKARGRERETGRREHGKLDIDIERYVEVGKLLAMERLINADGNW